MNHPRLSQELSQPISENLQKLAELFPAAVKDGALDIEALREELGEFEEIRPGDEKYGLNWVGKQAAKKEAFKPLLGKTLAFKREDSKHPEATENLYIEGDNLEALKLLRQNYFGEVKMIYIDPPYNTGKDFVYTDKFKVSAEESEEEEGAVSAEGKRLIKNEKSSNRFHARWLDMMYPRLRLAKDLLRDDGVIFISIDDNEVANLREVCDEVFQEENFEGCIHWRRRPNQPNDPTKMIGLVAEFVVVYAKNKAKLKDSGVGKIDLTGDFSNPDSDPRGDWASKPWKVGSDQSGSIYDIELPNGQIMSGEWMGEKSTFQSLLADGRIIFTKGGAGAPRKKYYRIERQAEGQCATNWWPHDQFGHNQEANDTVTELMDGVKNIFSNPKPIRLLSSLVKISNCKGSDLILDFFSGSATTAHAVMQLNAEDGGKRRHIMVQLPEVCDEKSEAAKAGYKTIPDIGRERIRRAGEKVKEDLRTQASTASEDQKTANPHLADPNSLDIGFKAFRIEDTKINWIRKDLRGEEMSFQGMGNQDALDFVPGFTDGDIVYEVMLRQSNIPLTQAISKPVPESNGKRTYLYGESYLVCLEETVTKELIETLAALEPTPLKYFFRDSAFGKDIALKDETFRRLNAEIAKNHGVQGTAYTVEFI